MRRREGPLVRLACLRVDGIGHELLAHTEHLNRVHADLGERLVGAIEVERLRGFTNAHEVGLAEFLLNHIADRDGNGRIKYVHVYRDDLTRQDTDACVGPLLPDVDMRTRTIHRRPAWHIKPLAIVIPTGLLGTRHNRNDGVACVKQLRTMLKHELIRH